MVFCGKPSGGCHACRQRKTRCDQKPDGCSQCARAKRMCPGYRVPELTFRNESENVIRKAKAREAKEAKARAASAAAHPTTSSTHPSPGSVNTEESMGIVRQSSPKTSSPRSLSPSHDSDFKYSANISRCGLGTPIEDRAVIFFASNYIIGKNGPTRGHLNYLADIYQLNSVNEGLLASMKAVGFAGYSHASRTPELMANARYQYVMALKLTNEALASPTDAKKDATLVSIMILGIFETVTGCNQRSLEAWAGHVEGASALLKLRGREQFESSGGTRIFIQVVSSLMINYIQLGKHLPEFIVRWTKEARETLVTTPDTTWLVQEAMIEFTNFRASVFDKSCSDPKVILARALGLDNKYSEIFQTIPSGWEYQTVYTDIESDAIYNGCYHIYYDYWIAQMWNGVRAIRILLHETIRDVLLAGLAANPPIFNSSEHSLQLHASSQILYKLQADILASVPQHLGFVSQSDPNNMNSASNDAASMPWAHFSEHNDEQFPIIRASGPYFLLWPLWLTGAMGTASKQIQDFVVKTLKVIAQSMGIQQAHVLATIIETKSKLRLLSPD